MKISIITATWNSVATIENAILSVASQGYPDLERIIVDGNSSDQTLPIIFRHADRIDTLISEPDHGIYDAMNAPDEERALACLLNPVDGPSGRTSTHLFKARAPHPGRWAAARRPIKGITPATGDVIDILNSDDFYAHSHVLEKVARVFEDESIHTCYGDLIYVDPANVKRVTRYWRSGIHNPRSFYRGWMPPHPTFFVRRSVYGKYGKFNVSLIRISPPPGKIDHRLPVRKS